MSPPVSSPCSCSSSSSTSSTCSDGVVLSAFDNVVILPHNETTNDTILALRRQARTSYAKGMATSSTLAQTANKRSNMAVWFYQVAEFCKYKKETVEIAMSNLDRYVSTIHAPSTTKPPTTTSIEEDVAIELQMTEQEYELAAIAAFFNAVKLHETRTLPSKLLSDLVESKAHTSQDIEQMELQLLFTLKWHVHPPTIHTFIHHFLSLVPFKVLNIVARSKMIELAEFQAEMAVFDPLCSTLDPAMVAFAALMNSIETVLDNPIFQSKFARVVSKVAGTDLAESCAPLMSWLCKIVDQHQQEQQRQQEQQEVVSQPPSEDESELSDTKANNIFAPSSPTSVQMSPRCISR